MSSVIFYLNRSNGVYYVNDVIEGSVTLTTIKTKYVQDIIINFNGRAKVLSETDDDVPMGAVETDTSRCIFRGEETFIDESLTVLTNGMLPAGTYNFNFKFDIKPDCPTSCEGIYGHVRYELSLEILRSYTYSNVFKHCVTVIRNFDLNRNDKYWAAPLETQNTKETLKSCLCALVNIYFTLKTPYCAFIPGQYIKYTLEFYRQSRDNILKCDVQLMKNIVFTADTPSRRKFRTRNVLVRHSYKEDRITSNIIENDIVIPPTTPTSSHTDLVYVKYYLQARAYLRCCTETKPFARHEITIGTVPLEETLTENERIVLLNAAHDNEETGNMTPLINDIRSSTAVSSSTTTTLFVDHDIPPINRIMYYPLYPFYRPYNY